MKRAMQQAALLAALLGACLFQALAVDLPLVVARRSPGQEALFDKGPWLDDEGWCVGQLEYSITNQGDAAVALDIGAAVVMDVVLPEELTLADPHSWGYHVPPGVGIGQNGTFQIATMFNQFEPTQHPDSKGRPNFGLTLRCNSHAGSPCSCPSLDEVNVTICQGGHHAKGGSLVVLADNQPAGPNKHGMKNLEQLTELGYDLVAATGPGVGDSIHMWLPAPFEEGDVVYFSSYGTPHVATGEEYDPDYAGILYSANKRNVTFFLPEGTTAFATYVDGLAPEGSVLAWKASAKARSGVHTAPLEVISVNTGIYGTWFGVHATGDATIAAVTINVDGSVGPQKIIWGHLMLSNTKV